MSSQCVAKQERMGGASGEIQLHTFQGLHKQEVKPEAKKNSGTHISQV